MDVSSLLGQWSETAGGELSQERYSIHLPIEDAARLAALSEMFPRRTTEQLITDLLAAALSDLERAMPYVEGTHIVSEDEMGNPIYDDLGPTPRFLALSQKYLLQLKDH
jgi:hypothetical protein